MLSGRKIKWWSSKNELAAAFFGVICLISAVVTVKSIITGFEDHLDDLDQAIVAYAAKQTDESRDRLQEVIGDLSYYYWPSKRESQTLAVQARAADLIERLERALLNANDWRMWAVFYDGNLASSVTPADLSQYEGRDPDVWRVVGLRWRLLGESQRAYQAFVTAALIDASYAKYPAGLAKHYGCTDLYTIWRELTDHPYYFGDPLPAAPLRLDRHALAAARMRLHKGVAPQVPEDCPLHSNLAIELGLLFRPFLSAITKRASA